MTLIDKAALVADIERMQKKYSKCPAKNEYMEGYKDGLYALDSAEIRDEDLEQEYKEYVDDNPVYSKLVNGIVGKSIAKHFFELGLAQKGGEK